MDIKREEAFNEVIDKLDELGLLPYVMIMGSWAEYLYSKCLFKNDYTNSLQTRDIDILYRNINLPDIKIPIASKLAEIGFLYKEDIMSGVAKFYKEDILELEFLTRTLGSNTDKPTKIEPLNIKSESMRIVNILADYPAEIKYRNHKLIVPNPSAFVVQKILTNPTRKPDYKKEKDLDVCERIMQYIRKDDFYLIDFKTIVRNLSKKQSNVFYKVLSDNPIKLIDINEIVEEGIEIENDNYGIEK